MNSPNQLTRLYPITGWLPQFGRIRDIRGNVITPRPNVLQKRIEQPYVQARLEDRPCRAIGLKPRKKGFSTAVAAIGYTQLAQFAHEAVLMGDKEDTSATVYNMWNVFNENDAFDWVPHRVNDWNEKRMIFHPHRGVAKKSTAQSRTNIRGMTPQFVHGTETAHWESVQTVLLALMNSIPDVGFNSVFLESTPNGQIPGFYDVWKHARWPTADECYGGYEYWRQWEAMCPNPDTSNIEFEYGAQFVRVFAAWFEFEDSFIRLLDHEKLRVQNSIDADTWYEGERLLIDTYGRELPDGRLVLGGELDEINGHPVDAWEQLAWRRMVIQTKCGRDPRNFDQEYPRDPESCFLASGRPYFDVGSVSKMISMSGGAHCKHGQLVPVMSDGRASFRVTSKEAGVFQIFNQPHEGVRYIVSCDPMTGEDQTDSDNPDHHSIGVVSDAYRDDSGAIHNAELAARVAPPCTVPTYVAAEYCDLLSRYYGHCPIIVEMNNSGLAVIEKLRTLNANIWQRKSYDKITGKVKTQDGWRTSDGANYMGTRRVMLQTLHSAIRMGLIDIWCPTVLHQLLVFCYNKSGKIEAPKGEKDDDVIMMAMAVENIDSAQAFAKPIIERKMPADLERHLKGVAADRHVGFSQKW